MSNTTKKKLTLAEREEKLVEVELLMLKGIQNPSKIAREIKVSFPTAKSYINAVRFRQEKINSDFINKMRIDLIERSREVEESYWETFKNGDNSNAKVGALNGLLEVQKHQAWLVGLNKINN